MQLGALQLPSGRRATTIPEPAFPEKTNPALTMVKTAIPNRVSTLACQCLRRRRLSFAPQQPPCEFSTHLYTSAGRPWERRSERSRASRGRLSSDCTLVCLLAFDVPRKLLRILAALSHSPGSENDCIRLDPPAMARELPSCNVSQSSSDLRPKDRHADAAMTELMSELEARRRSTPWELADTHLREGTGLLANMGCLSLDLSKEVGKAWHDASCCRWVE